MSYLDTPRIHLAGRFQAVPSTVNNNPGNYLGPALTDDGGWNAEGTGSWRLVGCRVTALRYRKPPAEGTVDATSRAVLLDDGDRVSAKLVDLDPEQQLVSEIWGLGIRLVADDGAVLLSGSFAPAPFFDLWRRCPESRGIASFGAFYQSVLEDLRWGDLDAAPLLDQLRRRSRRRLSVKFNVDGYNDAGEQFTYGRLVGSIGPCARDEPRHFVAGRLLRGDGVFAPALLDRRRRTLAVDLGNSLPTSSSGGPLAPATAGYRVAVRTGEAWQALCDVSQDAGGGYETRAGIVEKDLTRAELESVTTGHLGVLDGDQVYLEESRSRLHTRADDFVFRLNPGDEATVELRVSEAGKPPSVPRTISLALVPALGERAPAEALAFPATVDTDASGRARFTLRAADPGSPRDADGLDGQVYAVGWAVEGDEDSAHPSRWEFLSTLVWSRYPDVERPTWHRDVAPIFSLYHRLYPVMSRIVDLSDYDSVLEHLDLVAFSFNLPVTDPNHMPVTRDLSRAKHEMLRRWFEAPLRGRRPPTRAERASLAEVDRPAVQTPLSETAAVKGGRRLFDA